MAIKSLQVETDARWVQWCDRAVALLLHLTFLLIPLFFIILTRDQFELPKLTVLRILTVAMLGLWLIRILAARRFEFRRTPLDVPILVWVGLEIFSSLHSVSGYVSWLGEYENFRGLLTNLNYAALFYLCVNFIRTREQIDRLLFTVVLAGLLTTAYGIAQFFGIDFIAWNPTSVSQGRYFASMGNPNFLAAYLAMVMPLLVVFFVETTSSFKRLLLFLSFIAMFLCLLGTWSRGGFMGLIGALLVLAVFGVQKILQHYQALSLAKNQTLGKTLRAEFGQNKLWISLLGATLGLLILISATFGQNHMIRLANSVLHFSETIRVSRLHIWVPALNMIKANPVFGTGLDTFKTVFPRYATTAFAAIDGANVASRTAHNEILQVLATQGIVGFLIVGWLTLLILKNWRTAYFKHRQGWKDRLLLFGLLGAWTAYSIQNVFSFGVAVIDTFYWLVLALIILLQTTPEEQPLLAPAQTPDPAPKPLFQSLLRYRPALVFMIVLGAGYFTWKAYSIAYADYMYNLGTLYRLQGYTDQAVQTFSKAAEIFPIEVKYQVYKGLAFEEKAKVTTDAEQQKKLIRQAIAAYAEGLRLNPKNAYYLGNLGRAYGLASEMEKNQPDYYAQAVNYSQRAIEQAPVTVLFYQNLAFLYISHGDETGFTRVLDNLAKVSPLEASHLWFAAAGNLYNGGNLVKAREYYQKTVELDPKYVEGYFNLGVVVTQLVGPQLGITYWRKALEIKPDFEPAKQMLQRYETPLGRKTRP
ncbi:MAG: tetratricopeptide repeat protein [Candidatus Firestonebacteria bacterium]|nr:tetratricopeptide repeat protein [Candidatus Firestonebacteria bacterium]